MTYKIVYIPRISPFQECMLIKIDAGHIFLKAQVIYLKMQYKKKLSIICAVLLGVILQALLNSVLNVFGVVDFL